MVKDVPPDEMAEVANGSMECEQLPVKGGIATT